MKNAVYVPAAAYVWFTEYSITEYALPFASVPEPICTPLVTGLTAPSPKLSAVPSMKVLRHAAVTVKRTVSGAATGLGTVQAMEP